MKSVVIKTCDTDVLIIMFVKLNHFQNGDLEIFMGDGTENSKNI